MRSLPRIPLEIPAQFCNSYTPIDAAGTDSQIKHVSRLLAAQMTAEGIGPGIQEAINKQNKNSAKADSDDDETPMRRSSIKDKISVLGTSVEDSRYVVHGAIVILSPLNIVMCDSIMLLHSVDCMCTSCTLLSIKGRFYYKKLLKN